MPRGAAMSPKRVLTVADHLGSVGGTESAQLEIFRTPVAGAQSLARHVPIVESLEAGDVDLVGR